METNADTPKVSVIIKTCNRADLLPRAVSSVLSQTYTNYEIVIVDDCSKDNTQEVIAQFDDFRIRSFRHERKRGAPAAGNTGISNARGEYIALLDDDDEFLPEKLEQQVNLMDKVSCKVGLVYVWMDEMDDASGELRPRNRNTVEGDVFEYVLGLNSVTATSSLLARRSVVLEVGGLDEGIAQGDDRDLIARIARRYEIALVPAVLTVYHTGHGHVRLSDTNQQRHMARASSIRTHLRTFASELRERPKTHARLLRRLARQEIKCRAWKASFLAICLSFRLDPMNTLWRGVNVFVRKLARVKSSLS